MTRIILHGYLGAMGRVLTALADSRRDSVEIVAGVDVVKPQNPAPFPVFRNIAECDMPADVILDVSTASAVPGCLEYAARTRTNVIICTTGLSADTNVMVMRTSKDVAVFKSANMSLGVNLLKSLVKRAAELLYDEGFDIEIIEKHHNNKTDAPSGTALMLADTAGAAVGNKLEYVYNRHEVSQKRSRNQLGIHSVRGGNVAGEHSVIFAGRDELIELKHTAFSREIFAAGALKAAMFLNGKPPGLYTMDDLTSE